MNVGGHALTLTLALVVIVAAPCVADAQATAPIAGTFVYGLSVGAGSRSMHGTFRPPDFPAGASQPSPRQTVLALDLDGGVSLASRLAVFARLESGGTFVDSGTGHWGTLGLHGVARAWLTHRVWIEGGAGVTQLGYRPPPQAAPRTSSWWTPAQEGAAGFDIFQGPHVAINVLARYSTATFDGLHVNKMSVQVGLTGR